MKISFGEILSRELRNKLNKISVAPAVDIWMDLFPIRAIELANRRQSPGHLRRNGESLTICI